MKLDFADGWDGDTEPWKLAMNKVLVVHYSQSGQLDRVVEEFTRPLVQAPDINVVFENIVPVDEFPFPWPFFRFLDAFPESVYLDPPPISQSALRGDESFDLIILAYQVWFLSPSLPVTAFLKSSLAVKLLDNVPVVTLIACRNMWLMAQEQVKGLLHEKGARLVGNVALVDEAGTFLSFLATPMWVMSGNKGPFLGGLIPKAGVSEADILASSRFGERIRSVLTSGGELNERLLAGLGAVTVNPGLISSEAAGRRAFLFWGRLLRWLGPSQSWQRKPVLLIYSIFLITLICTVIPLGVLVKKLLTPLTRKRIAEQKQYFSYPSGESCQLRLTDYKLQ